MSALEDIAAERQRQVETEGWSHEHDDDHQGGALALAATCYALNAVASINDETEPGLLQRLWPWSGSWWKPKGQRRDLVRAAALLVAEIERLDRQHAREAKAAA